MRSFRTAQEIDFRDMGLVAIVGDTGAGKSSILEALTYALYNGSTWDLRSPRVLISDGVNTMRVELDFAAEGEVWRVVRSTSRASYPPSIHKLECLSDRERPQVDGETAVAEEIRRLVGLEHQGFCAAVVLPQGRFQELLQASKGFRTNILKSIFRLDQLGAMREVASAHKTRLEVAMAQFTAQRALLAQDPAAAAKEAEQERVAAAKLVEQLDKARGQYDDLRKQEEAAGERERRLSAYEEELTRCVVPTATLSELAEQYGALDEEAAKLDKHESDVREAHDHHQALISAAEERGEGKSALETAADRLRQLMSGLPRLASAKQEADDDAVALQQAADALAASDADRPKLVAAVAAANEARALAASAADTAEAAIITARDALAAYGTAKEQRVAAAKAIEDCVAGVRAADVQAQAAGQQRETALSLRNEARNRLEEIDREHAAAHAAAGLSPGDPCPICLRDLPDHFAPPVVAGRDEARAAAAEAEERLEAASRAAADAQANLQTARAAETQARTTADEAQARLAAARAALEEAVSDTNVERPADELLTTLREGAQRAIEALKHADEEAQAQRDKLLSHDAALEPKRQALEDRRARVERRRTEISEMEASLEAARSGIPESYRPPASATEFLDAQSAVEGALTELRGWEDARKQAAGDLQATSSAHRDVRARRGKLDTSWREAHDRLTDLQRSLDDGIRLLGAKPAKPPKMETPQDDAAAAKILEKRLTQLQGTLEKELETAADARAKLEREMDSLLAAHEAADQKAFEDRYVEARGQERDLARQVKNFEAQIPVARDLDERIDPLEALQLALDVLCSHITDGKFVGFAVERRQRSLLGSASDILARMTGDRYGFAADFDIVDKLTGQPRSTKTLSGGETFLASLALALGLVEMAARSGGRLDALFLDEGFGALDADALDDALSELERRAERGRLVGVISHIGAVAERIETVLRVDRTAEGSQARLIDQNARIELVERDLGEGLLA